LGGCRPGPSCDQDHHSQAAAQKEARLEGPGHLFSFHLVPGAGGGSFSWQPSDSPQRTVGQEEPLIGEGKAERVFSVIHQSDLQVALPQRVLGTTLIGFCPANHAHNCPTAHSRQGSLSLQRPGKPPSGSPSPHVMNHNEKYMEHTQKAQNSFKMLRKSGLHRDTAQN
jgi:hypothetical protein